MRIGREAWILFVLLALFVGVMVVVTRETTRSDESKKPTTYNTSPNGTRALYELFRRQGVAVDRLERPFTDLTPDVGLLVVIEPFDRPLQNAEVSALQHWLEEGGTLLHIAQRTPGEVEAGGLTAEEAKAEAHPAGEGTADIAESSRYAEDVTALRISGTTVIDIDRPDKVRKLVTAGQNVYAVTWREKKGRVILASSAIVLSNEQLKENPLDNPVFYANIARENTSQARPRVLFDEYHLGFGRERAVDKSLWAAIGPGLRAASWYALIGLLLLVYALNRRFGSVKSLPATTHRPSTEYIASMAALYQRAGAGALALETLLRDFHRDLVSRLDLEMSASAETLAQVANQRLGWDPNELIALLHRGGELVASPAPLTRPVEQEIVGLAQRLRRLRMELNSRKY